MEDPRTQAALREQEKRFIRERIRFCVESTIPFVSANPFRALLKRSISQGVSNHCQVLRLEEERQLNKEAV